MDAIRRLKDSSTTLPDPPSPFSPGSSGAARSSSARDSNPASAGPSSTNGQIPWYRQSRRDHPKSRHGYEFFRFSVQREGKIRLSEYVAFWPFCSPDHLEMANSTWDMMEGVFAMASCGRVIVARLSDDGYEELWTYETENENHYHVAWSYDPITLRPILATGGRTHVIWLFDHWQCAPFKILRGHGHDILSIVFHPLHPHILASCSSDRTIRIWNIYGTEVELEEGDLEPLSENYPQGQADEGSYALAILAGDKSGHKSGVSALAFHPLHNAIASGGMDHHVKIWPLPPIPELDPTMPPTRRGHRPIWIHQPLFSTDRLHGNPIDSIDWLNNDTLLSRACAEVFGWKWLGYKSCFKPDQIEPHNTTALHSDRISSHSFSLSLDILEEDPTNWYLRVGLHLAFNPTQDEIDFTDVDLVRDTIFAYSISDCHPPRLHLVNPYSWEPGPSPIPPFDGYRRPLTPDQQGEPYDPPLVPGGSEMVPIEIDADGIDDEMERDGGHVKGRGRRDQDRDDLESRSDNDQDPDEDDEDEDDLPDIEKDDGGGSRKKTKTKSFIKNKLSVNTHSKGSGRSKNDDLVLPTPSSILAPTSTDSSTPKDNSTYSQDPWPLILRIKDLEKAIMLSKVSATDKRFLKRTKKLFACVAISPRGAKWIVAVGEGESLGVWKLKDKPPSTWTMSDDVDM